MYQELNTKKNLLYNEEINSNFSKPFNTLVG